MFFASRKPKTTVFMPLVTKITVCTMFFGPGLAKTSVFTQFSACYKKYVFHAKGTKHCKLQCFGSALRVRGGGGWWGGVLR